MGVCNAFFWLCFALFLPQFASAECGKGCLICSPDDVCQQCDISSFFLMRNGVCALTPVVGCNATDAVGNCIACNNNFFIFNSTCYPVQQTIPNCVQYMSSTACSLCASGFYLSYGSCVKLKAVIQFCAVYSTDGSSCLTCNPNYVVTFDGQACTAAPPVPGCQSYTNLLCAQCNSAYINKPSAYAQSIQKVTNTSTAYDRATLLGFVNVVSQNLTASYFPTCLLITVANCQVAVDSDRCATCKPGHLLTPDQTCQPFPVTAIPFCSQYLNNVTCSLCSQGYYLAQNGSCVAVTQIANCALYSPTTNNNCLQCSDGFYSTGSSCVGRSLSRSIPNCQAVDPYGDKCLNCTALFTASYNGTACVAALANCAVYAKTAISITCAGCAQNYYLDQNGNCQLSSAQNCQNVTGLLTCGLCNQGYYSDSNGVCQQHSLTTLLACNTSSVSQANTCTQCDPDKALGLIDGMCLRVSQTLSNCLVYSNSNQCLTCDPTVSYKADGICYSAYIPNCALYSPSLVNSCASCRVDTGAATIWIAFPLGSSNNQCTLGNPNVANNCARVTNANNVEGCAMCAPNYYPRLMGSKNNAFCVPRNFYLLAGQSALLANCLHYNYVAKTCVVCAAGAVVDVNGVCVSQCSAGAFLYSSTFDVSNATDVSLTGFMVCSTTPPDYSAIFFTQTPFPCYFLAGTADGVGIMCGGCAAGQIGVIDPAASQINTVVTSLFPISGLISVSFYNKVPSVQQCVSRTVTLSGSTSQQSTLVARSAPNTAFTFDNCRFAFKSGSKYGCGACMFGYSGVPVADYDRTDYFMQDCHLISNCVPTVYYKGLGSLPGQVTSGSPPIDYFVSCHVCSGSLLPTFVRSSAAVTSVTPNIRAGYFAAFGVPVSGDSSPPYANSRPPAEVTSCQQPGFGLAFVPFCAVQELKIDSVIAAFDPALGTANNPLCQACLPGYAPTLTNQVITACHVISDCNFNSAKRFNKCDQCNANYALSFNAAAPDGLSDYVACILVSNQDVNCAYAYPGNASCAVCRPGYFLNKDLVCDSVSAWDCQTPAMLSPMNVFQYKSAAALGSGCQQCSDSSVLVRFATPLQLCVQATVLQTGITKFTSQFIIPNCQNFGFDSSASLICFQCASGFTITADGRKCVAAGKSLANCLVITNDGLMCWQCVDFYYAYNGVCLLGSNANCQTYALGQLNSCQTCLPGFTAVTLSSTYSVCIKNPAINCASFNSHMPTLGLVSCAQCQAGFYYETSAAVLGANPLKICLQVPPISNCAAYDNANGITASSLACLLCKEGYYVSEGTCEQRVNQVVANCAQLDPKADACKVCSEGFWLDSSSLCQPFPTGISGCIQYKTLTTCSLCDKRMYLQSNQCLGVPAAALVANCLYYDSNMNCQTCAPGFFLQSLQSCVQVTATNCATYVDPTHCATCIAGYGLIKTASMTYCSQISVPNCMVPDNSTVGPNFKCSVCQTSFYLNSAGGCTAVPANIPYCYLYSSATTCQACFSGYFLSPLNTSCVVNSFLRANADTNCLYSVILKTPVCNACQGGFTLLLSDNGTASCVQCNSTNPACLVCDPANRNACLSCKSGFSMDSAGHCSKTFQGVRALGSLAIERAAAALIALATLAVT